CREGGDVLCRLLRFRGRSRTWCVFLPPPCREGGRGGGSAPLRCQRRLHSDLQRRQPAPGGAVTGFHQKRQRIIGNGHVQVAEPALLVRESSLNQYANVVTRKRLETENLTAREQGSVDREERVLRCCANQDHHSVLDVGQENVLLSAVEAMNFVDEED